MPDGRKVALVTGEQFVGKGIRMGADYADVTMGKATEKLINRPSTWINLGLGILGTAYAAWRMSKGYYTEREEAALIIGTNILAEKLPDYAQEMMAPSVGVRVPVSVAARVVPARVAPLNARSEIF